jgi:hypothetical protein
VKRSILGVGAIVLLAFGSSVHAQQSDDCHAVVRAVTSVSGTSIIAKLRAREAAIGRWRHKVSERDGAGFTTWLKAHDRTVNCTTGTERTACTVEGFPCKRF